METSIQGATPEQPAGQRAAVQIAYTEAEELRQEDVVAEELGLRSVGSSPLRRHYRSVVLARIACDSPGHGERTN